VCFNNTEAAELSTPHLAASPASGATAPAGAPVTFSGKAFSGGSDYALTFSVASSPTLLSTPDIDSGPGSLQPGTSTYTFTSTKATAVPGTIYWAASGTGTRSGKLTLTAANTKGDVVTRGLWSRAPAEQAKSRPR
jgi:hypothetical protein